MSRWVALMLACRSERELASAEGPASIVRPAARRFTSLRTRTVAMTPKASIAVAANTSMLIISAGSAPAGSMVRSRSMASNLERDEAVHDVVAEHHPGTRRRQGVLGEVDVPDAGIVIGRDQLQDHEQDDRHGRENDRGEPTFGCQCPDLASHLEALADDLGQVFQDFAEFSAGRRLDGDGGDEQRQILLTDAEEKVAHRRL